MSIIVKGHKSLAFMTKITLNPACRDAVNQRLTKAGSFEPNSKGGCDNEKKEFSYRLLFSVFVPVFHIRYFIKRISCRLL
jgi:hypothetical protein